MRAGQDRQADHVHALVHRRAGDPRRRQPDALVDHVHAGVAGAHGDLLGAVRVAVEARLADQDLDAAPERLGHLAPRGRAARVSASSDAAAAASPTPVGARYSPNTSRSAPAHSPVVTPAARRPRAWRGMMFTVRVRGGLAQRLERGVDRGLVALVAPAPARRRSPTARPPGPRAGCRRPRPSWSGDGSASV